MADVAPVEPVNTGIQNGKPAAEPLSENVKNTVVNGPVAESVKDQAAKTKNEFSSLSAARTTPAQPAATGQQLTHYHSFFFSLLSWENPRASAIAYVSIVLFIFGARYLDLVRYAFKFTWMTLGVTVLAEIAGKTLFNNGFTTQIRPKKYYVLPKETIDAMIGDVHELINFFVIEAQRIVFAENVYASAAAFLGAFISYFLVKIVPLWGMCLIATSALFLIPLVYTSNQELIDHHVKNATEIVSQQTAQVKSLASHHASVAAETTKQFASEYTAKAQEMIGRRSSASPPATTPTTTIKTEPPAYKPSDFPAAPKQELKADLGVPGKAKEPLAAI